MNSPVEGIILRITHAIYLKVYTHANDSNRQVMGVEMLDEVDNTLEYVC